MPFFSFNYNLFHFHPILYFLIVVTCFSFIEFLNWFRKMCAHFISSKITISRPNNLSWKQERLEQHSFIIWNRTWLPHSPSLFASVFSCLLFQSRLVDIFGGSPIIYLYANGEMLHISITGVHFTRSIATKNCTLHLFWLRASIPFSCLFIVI